MRRTLGTAVFGGMLGVTLFGIFLTPVFYYVIQWLADIRAGFRSRRRRRRRVGSRKLDRPRPSTLLIDGEMPSRSRSMGARGRNESSRRSIPASWKQSAISPAWTPMSR